MDEWMDEEMDGCIVGWNSLSAVVSTGTFRMEECLWMKSGITWSMFTWKKVATWTSSPPNSPFQMKHYVYWIVSPILHRHSPPTPPRDVRKSQTKDFNIFKKRNTWYQLDVNSWSSTVYVRREDGNQTNTGSSVSFSYMCVCACVAHTPLRHAQFILRACAYDIISHKTWCHRPIGGLLFGGFWWSCLESPFHALHP